MSPSATMVTAGIVVQITSARVLPCVLKAFWPGRCRYFTTNQIRPTSTSTNAIPVMIVIARNRPSTSPANVEPLSGSHQCMRLSPRLVHLAAKLKSAVLVSLPATVTLAVCVPYFSCHASIVYVPGGRPLIANLPSPPLTPKNGWGSTPSDACIHPCTLHSSATMTSGLSNVFVEVITAGWLMLKGRVGFRSGEHTSGIPARSELVWRLFL